MKPSELKKDGNFSGRINKQVKAELKKRGVSIQFIIDQYIDKKLQSTLQVKTK